jgi:hypothetical protein
VTCPVREAEVNRDTCSWSCCAHVACVLVRRIQRIYDEADRVWTIREAWRVSWMAARIVVVVSSAWRYMVLGRACPGHDAEETPTS